MKRIDLFCKSQASTAICHSMDQHHQQQPPPPPSIQLGGRAIDRHNPIIRDGIRRTPCSSNSNLPINPIPYHQLHNQNKTRNDTNPDKGEQKIEPNNTSNEKAVVAGTNNTSTGRNSFSFKSKRYITTSFTRSSSLKEQKRKSGATKLSDNVERIADIIVRKSSAKRNEFNNVTPQVSSRYLLGDVKVVEGLSDDNYAKGHVVSLGQKRGTKKDDDNDALGSSCLNEPPSKPSSCQVCPLSFSLYISPYRHLLICDGLWLLRKGAPSSPLRSDSSV